MESPQSSYKQRLVQKILDQLNQEIETIVLALKAAYEAATHEESKAEDSHDTRGLEASYLAGAQAARLEEVKNLVLMYRFLPLFEFKPTDQVALGACIELELNGKHSHYFLVSRGGGMLVQVDGKTVQVLTPMAPLGNALVGRKVGEIIEVESRGTAREYQLISIL